jgi:hypothetical protein
MDLVVQEAILAKEPECNLRRPDRRNLLAELDKARARVDRIDGERTTEAERLSCQVMSISSVLVD